MVWTLVWNKKENDELVMDEVKSPLETQQETLNVLPPQTWDNQK